jgi:hypothetical protein
MKIPPELLPVIQITLPLIVAIFVASWVQNKRLDDIIADIREIRGELRGIREELKKQGERITRIEERLPPPLIHR